MPLARTLSPTVRTLTIVGVVALAAVAALTVVVAPSAAQDSDEPEPIEAEPLSPRGGFTDDVAIQVRDKPDGRPTEVVNFRDASHLAVVEITIQPGAKFPWHTHPGTALGIIAEGDADGAFEYIYADDCVVRPYEEGEVFVDPGGDNVHMARNPSDEHETVVMVTFVGVPDDGPLTLPVDPEEGAALDQRCGIER